MRNIKCVLLLINLALFNVVFAAPAVAGADDADTQAPLVQDTAAPAPAPTLDTSNMSVGDRVARLEQVVAAQQQMQLLNRINQMQQQIDALQGQNDLLRHQLDQLQAQQRAFYDDINQRLTVLEGGSKPVATPVTDDNDDDQAAYQKAYNLIVNKLYDQAVVALQNFGKQYPKSSYVPNSLYWQAEIYVVQGKPDQAKALFQQLIQQYPTDGKVPDAKYRLAALAADAGQTQAARDQLNAIIKQYPNSSAANLAASKLRQLKNQ